MREDPRIIKSICEQLNLNPYSIFFSKWGKKDAVPLGKVLELLVKEIPGPDIAKHFDRGEQTFNRAIKKLFPDVSLSGGQSWGKYIYSFSKYKECNECSQTKSIEHFYENKNTCKECKSDYFKEYYQDNKGRIIAKSAASNAYLKNAIPPWADLDKIKEIYDNCPEGYHVDHIIPLQGENICGLHIETNLQYLTAEENLKKGNKFPYSQ
jgi:hypothetical protein